MKSNSLFQFHVFLIWKWFLLRLNLLKIGCLFRIIRLSLVFFLIFRYNFRQIDFFLDLILLCCLLYLSQICWCYWKRGWKFDLFIFQELIWTLIEFSLCIKTFWLLFLTILLLFLLLLRLILSSLFVYLICNYQFLTCIAL